jgi:acid stress-induced BolA-like protein IbaG/YrbA
MLPYKRFERVKRRHSIYAPLVPRIAGKRSETPILTVPYKRFERVKRRHSMYTPLVPRIAGKPSGAIVTSIHDANNSHRGMSFTQVERRGVCSRFPRDGGGLGECV